MAYDDTHHVLAVINGDPGLPFITFIDMQYIVGATPPRTSVADPTGQGDLHCLPIDHESRLWALPCNLQCSNRLPTLTLESPRAFGYPLQGTGTGIPGTGTDGGGNPAPSPVLDPGVGGSFNPPRCIIGQIYYDGAGGSASGGLGLTSGVPVDTVGNTFPCPDPSNPHVFSGVSGSAAADGPAGLIGIGTTPMGVSYTIPCHHGPIISYNTGAFCSQTPPFSDSSCSGAIAPAGLGGMTFDPNSGLWLLTNENSVATTQIGSLDAYSNYRQWAGRGKQFSDVRLYAYRHLTGPWR